MRFFFATPACDRMFCTTDWLSSSFKFDSIDETHFSQLPAIGKSHINPSLVKGGRWDAGMAMAPTVEDNNYLLFENNS